MKLQQCVAVNKGAPYMKCMTARPRTIASVAGIAMAMAVATLFPSSVYAIDGYPVAGTDLDVGAGAVNMVSSPIVPVAGAVMGFQAGVDRCPSVSSLVCAPVGLGLGAGLGGVAGAGQVLIGAGQVLGGIAKGFVDLFN